MDATEAPPHRGYLWCTDMWAQSCNAAKSCELFNSECDVDFSDLNVGCATRLELLLVAANEDYNNCMTMK